MTLKLYFYVLSSFLFILSYALQCRDEFNKPVDWFVIYKVPKDKYMYVTSDTVENGWSLTNKAITKNNTAVAYTLAPYYKNNQSEIWVFYNDQPPSESAANSRGHSKGVLAGNVQKGFWLVHSVPHFPQIYPYEYSYPETGLKFGQIFLCISLSAVQLNSIGTSSLDYIWPKYYESRISKKLEQTYPDVTHAVNRRRTSEHSNKKSKITSLRSTTFQVFAKSKNFGRDIYEWLADELNVDVFVETWQNGAGLPLPTECRSKHKIMNIDVISYRGIKFNSTQDHSKWAVAIENKNPWVCIGDLNRAASQETRGGGMVCTKNLHLWNSFHEISQNVEPCPRPRLHGA